MKNPIYRLYQILPKEHIRSAYLLFGLIFIVSVFDAIGVASIFPFISLVSNPSDANEMTGIRVLQDLLDIIVYTNIGYWNFIVLSFANDASESLYDLQTNQFYNSVKSLYLPKYFLPT